MTPERASVAEIFRCAGGAFRERREGRIDAGRLKVMADIEACRTAVLGGHMYACDGCGREHPLYNSCRNRHYPTCQGLAANRWSEARADDILPVRDIGALYTYRDARTRGPRLRSNQIDRALASPLNP